MYVILPAEQNPLAALARTLIETIPWIKNKLTTFEIWANAMQLQIKTVKTEVKCCRKTNRTRRERLIQLRSSPILARRMPFKLSPNSKACSLCSYYKLQIADFSGLGFFHGHLYTCLTRLSAGISPILPAQRGSWGCVRAAPCARAGRAHIVKPRRARVNRKYYDWLIYRYGISSQTFFTLRHEAEVHFKPSSSFAYFISVETNHLSPLSTNFRYRSRVFSVSRFTFKASLKPGQ